MSLYDHLSGRLLAARLPHQLEWIGSEKVWAMRVAGDIVACGFSIGTMLVELQNWFENEHPAARGPGADWRADRSDPLLPEASAG